MREFKHQRHGRKNDPGYEQVIHHEFNSERAGEKAHRGAGLAGEHHTDCSERRGAEQHVAMIAAGK